MGNLNTFQKVNTDLAPQSNSKVSHTAEVSYDFTAVEGFLEMSVMAGTILEVLEEKCDDGWVKCRLVNDPNVMGLVPESYLDKI